MSEHWSVRYEGAACRKGLAWARRFESPEDCLLSGEHDDWRVWLLDHWADCPPDLLERLAEDYAWCVCEAVARHPACPPSALNRLVERVWRKWRGNNNGESSLPRFSWFCGGNAA